MIVQTLVTLALGHAVYEKTRQFLTQRKILKEASIKQENITYDNATRKVHLRTPNGVDLILDIDEANMQKLKEQISDFAEKGASD